MLFMKRSLLFLLTVTTLISAFAQRTSGEITLENLWARYQYFPQNPSGFTWMEDDRYYSVLVKGEGIDRYSVLEEKLESRILGFDQLDLGEVNVADIEGYTFSAGETQVLLRASVENIYRRSRRQVCMVVDLETQKVLPIHEGKKITNPTFSPDGSKLGFVFENNLYYADLNTGAEQQVTMDGEVNAIINGLTDWVYEEEFAIVQGFAWHPDGSKIGFYRFDESAVRQFNMPIYGSLYPDLYEFKYPKAGEDNSDVSLHIYDLQSSGTVMVDLGPEKDQYIPRMTWTPDGQMAIMRLNRLQNKVDVLFADAATGKTRTILTETSETYIREPNDFTWYFLSESEDFLWMSEKSGYYHVYRYNREGEELKALTAGDWEVTRLLGVDEENDRMYFESTEASPMERQLYSVSLMGKKKRQLTEEAGYHHADASSSFTYFVEEYSSTKQVPVTRLLNQKGKIIRVLEDNGTLERRVGRLDIAEPSFFSFETSEGVELNGYMIKPSDFDESKTYPVFMYVYGGPGSQNVMNQWGHGSATNYIWFQMLAQRGYIVACVDNRGTGGRGRDFRASTYADLGNLEVQDQVEAARYLGGLSYVDADRIGIWGWSYGGYMSSLCLTKGKGAFKLGIAVAPVTNWRFYDTIYTERYLKRPQDNPDGYDENSPINFARNLRGNYLLVHGTADDNVHFQNSTEWVNALVAANKQFDMFFYPNRNHGIYGGLTRYHLYNKMTNFVLENL